MTGSGSGDLYTELWKACAGPLVDVPRSGERVFYFPQGHIEQVCLSLNLLNFAFHFFVILGLRVDRFLAVAFKLLFVII